MKKIKKTKLSAIEQFRKDCEFWQEKLNLMDYDLTVRQEAIDDSNSPVSTLANVRTAVESRLVLVTLQEQVEELGEYNSSAEALHEMLHVRFAELLELVLRERSTFNEAVNAAEHSIIKVLVRLLCKS